MFSPEKQQVDVYGPEDGVIHSHLAAFWLVGKMVRPTCDVIKPNKLVYFVTASSTAGFV